MRLAATMLLAAAGLAAAELAPSADLGAMPEVSPRTWILLNIAPDDRAVAAQVPRRRETVIGATRVIDPDLGLGIHAEGGWSPVRAPRAEPSARVDAVFGGIGVGLERLDEHLAWRLSLTAGVRALTDLKSAELDRAESRLLRGQPYRSEGEAEDPSTVDPLLAARWLGIVRLTESDPLREKPVYLSLGLRAMRVFADDGDPSPGLRLEGGLLLPSRTTASWLGFAWQRTNQSPGGSRAVESVADDEAGWWFVSGGALRLGAKGDWLVEVGSAVDLGTGIAVGTFGVVRTGDPPRANHDGTSSLELVMLQTSGSVSAGIASGDQLQVHGPIELRTEIRTLLGDRREPDGAVTADALRLDGMLRVQAPFRLAELVSIAPEIALGLGLRRDAAEFDDGTFVAANRIVAVGDIGIAGRVATGWKDGIASLGASLGWAWWRSLGGEPSLTVGNQSIALAESGSGLIARFGVLATF